MNTAAVEQTASINLGSQVRGLGGIPCADTADGDDVWSERQERLCRRRQSQFRGVLRNRA
jgi:hypothetical protein